MRAFPTVKDVIVGNEQPVALLAAAVRLARAQRGSSRVPGGARAELRRAQGPRPDDQLIGLGLSPRGGDNPSASGNISHSPVKFLRGLGAAYRLSGRTKPLMDELAFHPYPKKDRDPLQKGYDWPNAGIPNFGRVKQAVWDAFHARRSGRSSRA
jgi:hypothetical protein